VYTVSIEICIGAGRAALPANNKKNNSEGPNSTGAEVRSHTFSINGVVPGLPRLPGDLAIFRADHAARQ
jgi:hypothetical protein